MEVKTEREREGWSRKCHFKTRANERERKSYFGGKRRTRTRET